MTSSVNIGLYPEPSAVAPRKCAGGAAGCDITYPYKRIYLEPGEAVVVRTSVHMRIPEGFAGEIRSRSELAKAGIVVANSPVIVDSYYGGEVCVLLLNTGKVPYKLDGGSRIAQLVVVPGSLATFTEWAQDKAERGEVCFGSTGK